MSSITRRVLKKDWVLTAEAFSKFLSNLDENQEKAAVIYEDIRKRLIRQFRASQSHFPEEQADEVLNRVARKIFEEGFELLQSNPYPYFHQTARYVLLEYQKQARRRILGLDDLPLSEEPFYDPEEVLAKYNEKIEKEVGLNALSNCRKQLSEKDQEILKIYDAAIGKDKKLKRDQLAENLDKTKNALKIYINRLRNKLIDCARKKIKMKLFS